MISNAAGNVSHCVDTPSTQVKPSQTLLINNVSESYSCVVWFRLGGLGQILLMNTGVLRHQSQRHAQQLGKLLCEQQACCDKLETGSELRRCLSRCLSRLNASSIRQRC